MFPGIWVFVMSETVKELVKQPQEIWGSFLTTSFTCGGLRGAVRQVVNKPVVLLHDQKRLHPAAPRRQAADDLALRDCSLTSLDRRIGLRGRHHTGGLPAETHVGTGMRGQRDRERGRGSVRNR